MHILMTAVASSPMKPYILSHNPDQSAMALVNTLFPGCIVSSYGDEYFVDRIYRKGGREINLISGSQDRGFSWDKFVPKGKVGVFDIKSIAKGAENPDWGSATAPLLKTFDSHREALIYVSGLFH